MISIWKDDWQIYGQCFEVGESEALVRYIFKGKLPPKHPHLDPVFKAVWTNTFKNFDKHTSKFWQINWSKRDALVQYIFKGKLPHPHLDPVFKAANNKVLKIEIICRKAWFNAYFLSQEIKKYE